eukprot:scaffold5922_cov160-Amphora_coffeaeformis.AAC.2
MLLRLLNHSVKRLSLSFTFASPWAVFLSHVIVINTTQQYTHTHNSKNYPQNGKLQSRRVSFTPDRRALLITTQKLKSWRGLWQRSGGSLLSINNSASKEDASLVTSNNNNNNDGGTATTGGDAKVIPLLHMDRIQTGFVQTARFIKAADQIQAALQSSHGGGAFSILYELYDEFNHMVRLESLDLVVPNTQDYQTLVGALQTFLTLVPAQNRQYVGEVQYLRYQWTLLSSSHHKPFEAPLNMTEWLVLADHMGLRLPKPKLQQLFQHQVGKQQKKQHSPSRRGGGNGNPAEAVGWSKIAYLVQKAYRMQGSEVDDPISNIWKDLLENDSVPIVTLDDSASFDSYELNVQNAEESISPVAFQGFLKDQQGEREWRLEQVVELIHALNSQVMAADESYELLEDPRSSSGLPIDPQQPHDTIAAGDRLCYERFRHYLLSGSNELFKASPPQDMSRPLSHYYICSSHDTYLAAIGDAWEAAQNGGDSPSRRRDAGPNLHAPTTMDAQNYLQALIRGSQRISRAGPYRGGLGAALDYGVASHSVLLSGI